MTVYIEKFGYASPYLSDAVQVTYHPDPVTVKAVVSLHHQLSFGDPNYLLHTLVDQILSHLKGQISAQVSEAFAKYGVFDYKDYLEKQKAKDLKIQEYLAGKNSSFDYYKNLYASTSKVEELFSVHAKEAAVSSSAAILSTLTKAVPGLKNAKTSCPANETCGKGPYHDKKLSDVIIHLNDRHKWTREKIADWLETLDVDLQFVAPEETSEGGDNYVFN